MGADISSDGLSLALISDDANRVWIIKRADLSNMADFITNSYDPTLTKILQFDNQQGEAVCFTLGTYDFIAASESPSKWFVPESIYNP